MEVVVDVIGDLPGMVNSSLSSLSTSYWLSSNSSFFVLKVKA